MASLQRSLLGWRLAAAVAVVLGPVAARADCNGDMGALMKKRLGITSQLDANKRAHGGKLDPALACPQLRTLAAAQGEVLNYMIKNKDWCGLPDELITKMTEAKAQMNQYSAKACSVAIKIKQMQEQQAKAPVQALQALKLPAGPL